MPPTIIIAIFILGLLSVVAFGEERVAYLAYLLSQKQQLQSQVSKIAAINHNLILNLQLNSQANYQQRWTASAIRDQHSLAIDALPFTFISLANKNASCSSQDNQFGRKLTAIQTQLDKVRPIVSKQPACLRNDYIRSNLKFYQTVYDGLKSETINDCKGSIPATQSNVPFLNIQTSKFVPNTDSQAPWIYGSLTPQQYLSKRNQLMNIYGAVSCAPQTPFLDASNNCQACLSNQVYDISLKQCRACDANTTYNQITHQCDKSAILFNSQLAGNLNFIGIVPTSNPQASLCPNDKPYSIGKTCISCSLPMYFSFLSNTCQQCKNDSIFDTASKACITNSFFLSNLTGVKNFIGSPLSPLPYDSIKTCPSATPFSNGKLCSSCLLPSFFNFEQMACQSCPKDYSFDTKTHSCTSSNANAITLNSNLIDNRNFIGKIPLYSNLFKNCQANTPFFNGKQCISCSLPFYFDFDTLTCTSCQAGLSFNNVIQACEYINQDYFTDLTVSNIYYNGDFDQIKKQVDQRKSSNPNTKVCFANNPYYNSRSNTCISCPDPLPLFDFKNNKCITCPSGSEFDQESHICLTKKVGATIERMIMNST